MSSRGFIDACIRWPQAMRKVQVKKETEKQRKKAQGTGLIAR